MIVKDESHIILECLNSIYKYIDYWVICDTGSSDNTPGIITSFFEEKGIPGELLHHEWKGFGHNRTFALEACLTKGDYIWMIDADDVLVGSPNFPENMDKDSYLLRLRSGVTWWRTQIFKSDLDWKYIGVLHEYPYSDKAKTRDNIQGDYYVSARTLGNRSKNITQREKYLKDAEILEKGLEEEPENERYVFYLAQSYRDAGEVNKAIEFYQKRFDMQKWGEEAYYALYQKSCLSKSKGDPSWFRDALKAYFYRPNRLESLYEIVRECRLSGDYQMGLELGKKGLDLIHDMPADVLFVHADIHSWKFWDELSLCAYYTGNQHLFKYILEEIIERVPESDKLRVQDNFRYIS
jgi:glycosyltransferase involved in cell wall biosynthesis